MLTVLFVDVVGSTEHLVAVGDRRWRELLRRYNAATSELVQGHGGRVVNVTGDGMLSVSRRQPRRCAARRACSTARRSSNSTCAPGYTPGSARCGTATSPA